MSNPEFVFNSHWGELLPSEGNRSTIIIIIINIHNFNIIDDPSTRSRYIAAESTQRFSPVHINLNNNNNNQNYIQSSLQNQIGGFDHLLCSQLASHITARILGIAYSYIPRGYSLILTVNVRITFVDYLPFIEDKEMILKKKMVLKGRLDREEVMKMVKTDESSCSICLDDLSDSSKHGYITRMTCSHVFHDDCLLKWFQKRNTCPLCRTVLYN